MNFAHSKESNLFADSDCDNELIVEKGMPRKRRRTNSEIQDLWKLDEIIGNREDEKKEEIYLNQTGASPKIKENVKQLKHTTNQLWSIEDTLFYPCGIRSHYIVGINKSVLLIWSELSVINFVIKRNPKTKQTKTTRVQIFTNNNEEIKDIQVLDFNTLLLLESGRMHFFSSSKSMHTLPWIDNVRCFSKTYQNGFSVIRLTNEQKLVLQTFDDLVDMGKHKTGPLRQQYEITFDDENLFNCDWKDEHYYLLSSEINESNIEFLQLLTRTPIDLKQHNELHLFALSGNIFALLPDMDASTYNIVMLFSYSSNVATIKLDFEKRFCFVFLHCGVIDIWYMSMKVELLRHKTYTIGAQHTSFSYSESRAALYFSDGDQVAEFRFLNTYDNDDLILNETYKAIPGILCCTWIEAIDQLVCLDCNNIFHQISFESLPIDKDAKQHFQVQPVLKTAEYEKFNTLFELTPQRVEQLLKKSNVIKDLHQLPESLYLNIDQELKKQQILSLFNKRCFFNTQFSSHLEFIRGPLNVPNDAILLYTTTQCMFAPRSLVALIHVEIKGNDIFRSSIWQLHLKLGGFSHVFIILKAPQKHKLCLVAPLKITHRTLPPEFQLNLYTFVSCACNFVALALQIPITSNENTFAQLFSSGRVTLSEKPYQQYNLENLIEKFNKAKKHYPSVLACRLSLPKDFKLKFILHNLFDDEFLFEENAFDLGFLGSEIHVLHNAREDTIQLQSRDSNAILYLKLHMQLSCEQSLHKTKCLQDNRNKILQYHSCLEQLYGTLENANNEGLSENPQTAEKIKVLTDLYLKIRKNLNLPLHNCI